MEGRVLPDNGKLQLLSYTWLLLTRAILRTVSCAGSGAVLILVGVQGPGGSMSGGAPRRHHHHDFLSC